MGEYLPLELPSTLSYSPFQLFYNLFHVVPLQKPRSGVMSVGPGMALLFMPERLNSVTVVVTGMLGAVLLSAAWLWFRR